MPNHYFLNNYVPCMWVIPSGPIVPKVLSALSWFGQGVACRGHSHNRCTTGVPVSQEKVTESFIWPTTDGAVSASVVTHRCSATYHCLSVLDIFCCTDVETENITVNRHVPQHSWFIAQFRKSQRIYLTPSLWASTNFPGTPHTVQIRTKLIGPLSLI